MFFFFLSKKGEGVDDSIAFTDFNKKKKGGRCRLHSQDLKKERENKRGVGVSIIHKI